MIVVIEAGGTKTELRTLKGEEMICVSGAGINPYFQDDAEIFQRLSRLAAEVEWVNSDAFVYYYGAGLGQSEQQIRIESALAAVFPTARVSVFHDLLGSARALCGHESGFAGILGTGSNGCIFNGKEIVNQMVSLGFWLGDEGSGGYLGKMLVTNWLKGRIPNNLVADFEAMVQWKKEAALRQIYSDHQANSQLASLARFCFSHRGHQFIEELIEKSLMAYFREIEPLLEGFSGIPMHFSGSVASLLKDDLTRYVQRLGQTFGNVTANPSQALFEYHLSDHL
ncbi:MAG TPA: hypothetical protein PKY12_07630 [Catalimonadaceae bacterium]|nr:hypothetical protein [Catalimonadaceae bacterium]